jgi:hypothetical protein
MFDEYVNTAIILLKDKNKGVLATDVEERWKNIEQKAMNFLPDFGYFILSTSLDSNCKKGDFHRQSET